MRGCTPPSLPSKPLGRGFHQKFIVGDDTLDMPFAPPQATQAIAFPWGLPGLAAHRSFELLELPGEAHRSLLRSASAPKVALFVVDPWVFFPDYCLELPFYARLSLELNSAAEAAVRCVYLPDDPACGGPSVNLHAPIVINPYKRIARQVFVDDARYQIHTPITQDTRQEAGVP